MRTVIFVGLLAIAKAINPSDYTDSSADFLAYVLFFAILFDISEGIKKL